LGGEGLLHTGIDSHTVHRAVDTPTPGVGILALLGLATPQVWILQHMGEDTATHKCDTATLG
jgi:hypothetical protein